MKLGVFNLVLIDKKLEEALDIVKSWGLDAIELGSGGFVPKNHVNPAELLVDDKKRKNLIDAVEKRGLIISALSCHGNIVHPQKSFADQHRKDLRETIQLAGKIGVERICMFAGCPGASEKDQTPNFISCPWPDYFSESSKWQWEKRIIPAWKEEAEFAKKHGVKMIAFEMAPGDAVYNPETLLKLREAAGDVIGCNFDPSHLFWQGIDPIAALRALKDCIYHVHAKDLRVDPLVAQVNGVLDTKPYGDEINRSWIFRTVGYGHGSDFWTNFVSTLRLIGYDYVLSIEHEDSLMSGEEGIKKAITFLRSVLIEKPRGAVWWDLDL
jgi:sugar phosphate isomerase/epimerase